MIYIADIVTCKCSLKAMLHEAIFLATCNAKNVALQVARKNSLVTPHFENCNCCVASCKKSRTTLHFSQRCETSCLRVTSLCNLQRNFVRMGQSELIFRKMSATQRVRHLVCYCTCCKLRKKLQTCDTPSAT